MSKITYMQVCIDNFVLNEETITRKSTTHFMALVFFQEKFDSLTSND
jgi:hypothetical protein